MGWFDDDVEADSTVISMPLFPDKPYIDPITSGLVQGVIRNTDIPSRMILAHTQSFGPKVEKLFKYGESTYYYGLPSGELTSSSVPNQDVANIAFALNKQAEAYLATNVSRLQAIEDASETRWINAKVISDRYYLYWQEKKLISDTAYTSWLGYLGDPTIKSAYESAYDEALVQTFIWEAKYQVKLSITTADLAQYTQDQAATVTETSIATNPNISIISSVIQDTSPEEIIYEYLQDTYRFDPVTGEMLYGNPEGITRFLFDYEVLGSRITVTLLEEYFDGSEDTYSVELIFFYPNELSYQVTYRILNATSVHDMYWNYRISEGTYPLLIGNVSVVEEFKYLPIMPVRINGKFIQDKHKDDPIRVTVKKALKLINLSLEDITKGIAENPDLQYIDDVTVVLALHPTTQEPFAIEYFMEFFSYIHNTYGSRNVRLRITEQQYNIKVSMSNIAISQHQGQVLTRSDSSSVINTSAQTLTLIHQETNTTYKKVVVTGLRTKTDVWSKDTQHFHYSLKRPNDDAFRIPINQGILKRLEKRKSTIVLYEAGHLVIYTISYTYTAWYESGIIGLIIKVIILIIVIVISIVFPAFAPGLMAFAMEALIVSIAFDILNIVLTYAFGAEVAGYILLVAAVAVAVLSGDLTKLNFKSVIYVLGAVAQLSSMVVQSIVSRELEGIKDDYLEFDLDRQEKNAELEAAEQLLLGPPEWLATLWMPQDTNPSQTVEQFYNLKLSTNMAKIVLDMPQNYVSLTLALPKVTNIDEIKQTYADKHSSESKLIT